MSVQPPTFDSSKPRELSRYFEKLEQLIRRAVVTSEEEEKQQVLCYVDINTEQIWKTFPEFIDNNKTYNDFEDVIITLARTSLDLAQTPHGILVFLKSYKKKTTLKIYCYIPAGPKKNGLTKNRPKKNKLHTRRT